MATRQKGAISFGLVHIPVALYGATQENSISFNQLSKDTHNRIRYKKVDGAKEVTNKDIVRGYQYAKDEYVIITDDDIEAIKTKKDSTIQILQFVEQSAIPAVYYKQAYYLTSEKGGEKALELLRQAMIKRKVIALGKTVLGTKETMLALMPTDDAIMMQTMFFADEIRALPKAMPHPKLDKAELDIADKLIASMEKPFEPDQYKDEYQERLAAMIENKIEGRKIVRPKEDKGSNVISLMDALQKSLEQGGGKKKKATTRKTGTR